MIRFFTYLFAGIVLGGIIHISVILIMPILATNSAWTSIGNSAPVNEMRVIKSANDDLREALNLDPAFAYALCRVDLRDGPVAISGKMPANFWTAALVEQDGSVPYSTNSRTNNNRDLKIGIFTADQAKLLITDNIEIDAGLQIIRVPSEELTAVVRVLPSHGALISTTTDQLSDLQCTRL